MRSLNERSTTVEDGGEGIFYMPFLIMGGVSGLLAVAWAILKVEATARRWRRRR
jgi:hypothetical protein